MADPPNFRYIAEQWCGEHSTERDDDIEDVLAALLEQMYRTGQNDILSIPVA